MVVIHDNITIVTSVVSRRHYSDHAGAQYLPLVASYSRRETVMMDGVVTLTHACHASRRMDPCVYRDSQSVSAL